MSSSWPSSVDGGLSNDPSPSTLMNASPYQHDAAHSLLNDALKQVETILQNAGQFGPASQPYSIALQMFLG